MHVYNLKVNIFIICPFKLIEAYEKLLWHRSHQEVRLFDNSDSWGQSSTLGSLIAELSIVVPQGSAP